MNSKEIRQAFLDFFQSKGHEIVPSAPMVIKNDPTLMFTNAGMNQFKDFFLGNAIPQNRRIADTQKCLRVSGKHNDLEEVGVDTYHHTMFEMLGNWSFGDSAALHPDSSGTGGYFKEEAIEWAWELLTKVYGIEKNRLYVTVFGGEKEDNLPTDTEAIEYWEKWIPGDRILKCGKKDNFWEMGDTGPCGPCSEVHYDLRDESERKKVDGKTLVNTGNPQVIEIWNLVFIQFERRADGSLKQLPAKHVDTGMGFERLCLVLQKKKSNYDTDVFSALIDKIGKISKIKYGHSEKTDIAIRVIADHIRAISFSIADGQLPSNIGAGYVIRRILRRAVRYGYSFLKQEEPLLYKLVPMLADQMGVFFPEIKSQRELIEKVIKEEEEAFLRTLEKGLKRLDDIITEMKGSGKNVIDGKAVFDLHSTYGFPNDLTELIAKENGVSVDKKGLTAEFEKEVKRSQDATKIETGDWIVVQGNRQVEFLGYSVMEASSKILMYRKAISKGKVQFQIVLDRTPFYAESGGQTGDTGVLISPGNEKIFISDTKKENNLIIHLADKLPAGQNGEFRAVVNQERRFSIMNNHSATHLLHEGLRKILGVHVQQKGSLVHSDYLRFDFSHFQKLSEEEIEKVEFFVNDKIRKNISAEIMEMPLEEAKKSGAMALFGEKYGDLVRVVRFDGSVELCGGTHVSATGQIGFFKIVSESAIAAGVRRIEAITGEKAQQYVSAELKKFGQVKSLLKNPKDVEKSIHDLLNANSELSRQVEILNNEKGRLVKEELLKKAVDVKGVKFISEKVNLDSAALKTLVFQMKAQLENLFIVIGNESSGKANITVGISDNLVKERKLNASEIIRELAREINGGGGGQPNYATAGGSNINGIEKALEKAKTFLF